LEGLLKKAMILIQKATRFPEPQLVSEQCPQALDVTIEVLAGSDPVAKMSLPRG
jgi:hypothetical protein